MWTDIPNSRQQFNMEGAKKKQLPRDVPNEEAVEFDSSYEVQSFRPEVIYSLTCHREFHHRSKVDVSPKTDTSNLHTCQAD